MNQGLIQGTGSTMETVLVSPQFQVVIPPSIREALKIQPGQAVQILQYNDRIEIIPLRPMAEARGFLRGIDTSIERESDRV
jgi:AbrB family looped-hinge helix DNA binding protein